MGFVYIVMTGYYKNVHKRKQNQVDDGPEAKRVKSSSKVIDYSNPFAVSNMLEALDSGKFGSVSKELEEIADMRMDLVKRSIWLYPSLAYTVFEAEKTMDNQQVVEGVINLDDDDDDDTDVEKKALCVVPSSSEIVLLDSDDEDNERQRPMYQFQSTLVQHQKNQGDVTPLIPQCSFEEVDLGRGKEMPSAIKAIVVSSVFLSS